MTIEPKAEAPGASLAPIPAGTSPFTARLAPSPRGFFAKLLFQSAPADARRAITNRLATTPVGSVGAAEVSADLTAFGVHGNDAREVLLAVWREAVETFLSDDIVTDDESRYLADLRRALGLTEPELRKVEEELVHARYAAAVGSAIADDNLSAQDRAKLDALAAAIRLPKDVAQRLLDRARQQRIDEVAQAAIADRRLSPQELNDLHVLARNLDINLTIDAQTQQGMDRLALLWRIENGEPPVMSVPINLQKGESCHAVADAIWHVVRTRTQRINYGGPVASIRICKGLRYRVGSVQVQRITRDEMVEIDRGRLYVTNKRVIFDGAKKNTTIRLSALLSFSPYSDGVALEKASGKAAHLVLQNVDLELFLTVLGAVLSTAD